MKVSILSQAMKYGLICLFLLLALSQKAFAQPSIEHMDPPNWWVDMEYATIEIVLHGDKLAQYNYNVNYSGVELLEIKKLENPNYVFLELSISKSAKAGDVSIEILQNQNVVGKQVFPILNRKKDSAQRKGFSSEDVIYLITPDRFANGDSSNDEVSTMKEGLDRSDPFGRHGGDLKGILDHLDYLEDMGFTSLWLNPILENNMPRQSYHGYAITDFYQVDPRFGSLQDYTLLSAELKKRNMKLIMDMVENHCGSHHWWMEDLPSQDWLHHTGSPQITNHRKTTAVDPYASKADRELTTSGWFVKSMPDLNQANPHMARYLIQNSIWWIETADLDGVRQDTYSYPDHDFMNDWSCAIMTEYPNFNIVGEEWHRNPYIVSRWQSKDGIPNDMGSCLPSLMDFPLQFAMVKAFKDGETWDGGLGFLYESLAMDALYADPENMVIFADNHDMSRIFTQLDEDVDLFNMAMTFILTTRGIPQLFYGTEITMSNPGTESHGIIRTEFPGGWPDSETNAFTQDGLNKQQLSAQNRLRNLLNYRKNSEVLKHGNLVHFAPQDGIYAYVRFNENEVVLVIFNKNEKASTVDLTRFQDYLQDNTKAIDFFTKKEFTIQANQKIPGRSSLLLEFD